MSKQSAVSSTAIREKPTLEPNTEPFAHRAGDRLISTKELCRLHNNCAKSTIQRRRKRDKTFPTPVEISSQFHMWWEKDALAHLASKQKQTT